MADEPGKTGGDENKKAHASAWDLSWVTEALNRQVREALNVTRIAESYRDHISQAMPDLSGIADGHTRQIRELMDTARIVESYGELARQAMPDLSGIADGYTRQIRELDDSTRLAESYGELARQAMPDLSRFTEGYTRQIRELMDTAQLTKSYGELARQTMPDLSNIYSAAVSDNLYKAAGMLILADSVPAEVATSEQWRRAANSWLDTHAKALLWWTTFCFVVLLYVFVASTGGYQVADWLSTVVGLNPVGILSIALVFYGGSKTKK